MKNKRKPINNKQSGLTLIELVIVIIIISILGLSLSNYLLNSVKANLATTNNINALTKSQLIDKRLNLEIREVDFNAGAFTITTSTSTTLAFTNAYSAKLITINYNAAANSIELDYDGVTTTLSNNISAFAFTYYDANGAVTSVVADMFFVEYNYDITESGATYTSTNRVLMRDRQ